MSRINLKGLSRREICVGFRCDDRPNPDDDDFGNAMTNARRVAMTGGIVGSLVFLIAMLVICHRVRRRRRILQNHQQVYTQPFVAVISSQGHQTVISQQQMQQQMHQQHLQQQQQRPQPNGYYVHPQSQPNPYTPSAYPQPNASGYNGQPMYAQQGQPYSQPPQQQPFRPPTYPPPTPQNIMPPIPPPRPQPQPSSPEYDPTQDYDAGPPPYSPH